MEDSNSAAHVSILLKTGLIDSLYLKSLTSFSDVAKILANRKNLFENCENKIRTITSLPYDPFFYTRRKTNSNINIGHKQVPRVVGDLSSKKSICQNDIHTSIRQPLDSSRVIRRVFDQSFVK